MYFLINKIIRLANLKIEDRRGVVNNHNVQIVCLKEGAERTD